jgi:hypothetical protein
MPKPNASEPQPTLIENWNSVGQHDDDGSD